MMKKLLVGIGCVLLLAGCGVSDAEQEFLDSGRAKAIESETDLWIYEEFPEIGMSIQLPQDVIPGENFWIDFESIDLLPEEGPLGFDQKTANFNRDALRVGEYGHEVDWPQSESKHVREIGDMNAQDFVVMRRFEVCDVALDRTVYFLKNGYQVVIGSSVPRDEVLWMLPEELLTTDVANCGDELVWADGAPESLVQALRAGVADEAVQQWYDQFDQIIGTITFFE